MMKACKRRVVSEVQKYQDFAKERT